MPERLRYPTVADTRTALEQIIAAAEEAREYTGLYEAVYADDLSEELVLALEHIAATARGAAKRQAASHERAAELTDSVTADLDRLKVTDPDDALTGSLWGETADAEDRQGVWWASDPQTDREDDTADRHDEWVEEWNRTVRGHYRDVHPFPIDPDSSGVDW